MEMEIRAYRGIDTRIHVEYWEYDESLKGWQIVDKNSIELDSFNDSFESLLPFNFKGVKEGNFMSFSLGNMKTKLIKLAKRQFLRDFVDSKMVNYKQDSNEDSSK